MKRMNAVAIGIALLLPVSMLAAADAQPSERGTIIVDTTINPGDSPLVRAAKEAAARREQLKVHASTVIDNYTLRTIGGHVSQANESAASLPNISSPAAGGGAASPSSRNRAQLATPASPINQPMTSPAPVGSQLPRAEASSPVTTPALGSQLPQAQTNPSTTYAPVGSQLPQAQTSTPTTTPVPRPPV